MDAPKAPDSPPSLAITPARFEIVLAEDASNPLAFVSPPIADISEMGELARNCFSLKGKSGEQEIFQELARSRLSSLQAKVSTFYDSPTIHNRLANLQRAIGDLKSEARSLEQVIHLDQRPFFRRKMAENLFRSGSARAREAFKEISHDDSYSCLRIASMCLMEGDADAADCWVAQALELTPDGYAERLFQGGLLLLNGNFIHAVRIFWMAIEERPTSSVAYYNLGLAYLGAQNPKKAFTALKRSIAMDPLNRSAILALADVGYLLDRDADVINCVRYFVEFEQREPAIWSRLARSLLRIGALDECIDALKRQGAFEKSVSLWNNLGVAYALGGRKQQSLQAFNYALSVSTEGGARDELVVGRNIAQLVSTLGKPELLLSVTSSLVENDLHRELSRDPQLCDVYGFHIRALLQNNRRAEALALGNTLIRDPSIGEPLGKWLTLALTGIYGLWRDDDYALDQLLDHILQRSRGGASDVGIHNNVAFALAELGRLDEAEMCLARVGNMIHKDAYLTATLGLLNLRRGRRERGEALYKEAISLAIRPHDKTRLRQKMFLEIGRIESQSDPKKARRALEKVVKEIKGEAALVVQARELVKALPRKQ